MPDVSYGVGVGVSVEVGIGVAEEVACGGVADGLACGVGSEAPIGAVSIILLFTGSKRIAFLFLL